MIFSNSWSLFNYLKIFSTSTKKSTSLSPSQLNQITLIQQLLSFYSCNPRNRAFDVSSPQSRKYWSNSEFKWQIYLFLVNVNMLHQNLVHLIKSQTSNTIRFGNNYLSSMIIEESIYPWIKFITTLNGMDTIIVNLLTIINFEN